MGGKSRKTGGVSEALIRRLQDNQAQGGKEKKRCGTKPQPTTPTTKKGLLDEVEKGGDD